MPKLRFDGWTNPPPGCDPADATVNIHGVGKVKAGEIFNVSETRAQELLSRKKLIFTRVGKGKDDKTADEPLAVSEAVTGAE